MCKEITQQKLFSRFIEHCDFGDSGICELIGQIYYLADEYKTAKPYLKKACDNGIYTSCLLLAQVYGIFEKDSPNGAKYYEIVCNKASGLTKGIACGYLGSYYAMGLGVRQDIKKAHSLYRLSCESGATIGCVSIGSAYEVGQRGAGIKQNMRIAKEYYGRGCDLGNRGYEESCAEYRKLNEQGIP